MLDRRVIKPVTIELVTPIVLAPKSNGALRSSVEFRQMNVFNQTDSYPYRKWMRVSTLLGYSLSFARQQWVLTSGNK